MISLPRLLSRAAKGKPSPPPPARQPAPRLINVGGCQLPLVIRRLRRARRITLRLAPDGSEARISMPEWARTAEAVRFAEMRRDWLAGQLARIPPPARIEPGGTVAYRGAALPIDWQPAALRRPKLAGGMIAVGGTAEGISGRLQRWLEAEALRITGEDLAHYCGLAGHTVPKLALSRAQRRWGSCSSGGTIRINWRLIMAPDFVRRSVVAHEVAHMAHFDHSPAFHAHLAALYEAPIEAANDWLRLNGRTLYQLFG